MTPENLRKSKEVFNNQQLNFIAACLLGDGSLAKSGRLVISHGMQQADYIDWKAEIASQLFNQNIKATPTRNSKQMQFQRKFLKEIRYKMYPNNNKSIPGILQYITNPLEALVIWLCDDGNICPSINTKNNKCYSASIQIFTFTNLEDSKLIADWFEKHFKIRPNLIFMDRSKQGKKSAYKLKFSAQDSYKLFNIIKDFIPKVKSMEYKFRFIYNLSTRPQREIPEKIV